MFKTHTTKPIFALTFYNEGKRIVHAALIEGTDQDSALSFAADKMDRALIHKYSDDYLQKRASVWDSVEIDGRHYFRENIVTPIDFLQDGKIVDFLDLYSTSYVFSVYDAAHISLNHTFSGPIDYYEVRFKGIPYSRSSWKALGEVARDLGHTSIGMHSPAPS
jgi:hypothetical protein